RWTYHASQAIVGPAIPAGKFVVISERDNSIMAINPEDGTSVWVDEQTKEERPVHMLHNITGPLVAAGDNVLVMDDYFQLMSVDLITKKAVWTQKFSSLDATARPMVIGDTVIINSG